MPRQRRLHFNKESDGRRKKIIDSLLEIAPQITIYDAANQPRQRQRDACMRLLVADAAIARVDTLVFERDDSVVDADRRLLFDEIRRLDYSGLRYLHLRGHEEPCSLFRMRSPGAGTVVVTGARGSSRWSPTF